MKPELLIAVRRTLVLAGLTVCASLQAQAATELFTGSASLSNLNFSLIDLAPQSGQGTWIQFGRQNSEGGIDREPGWGYITGLLSRDANGLPVSTAGQDVYFDGPVPQQSYSLTAADGSGTLNIGPSGITSTVRVGANALDSAVVVEGADRRSIEVANAAQFGSTFYTPNTRYDSETGGYTLVDTTGPQQFSNFTLSAHTQLVFEADAVVAINPGLDAPYLPWEHPGADLELSGDVNVGIALARATPTRAFSDSYANWDDFINAVNVAYDWQDDSLGGMLNADPALMTPAARHLRVTLTNNGDVAMEGVLLMAVGAGAAMTQAVPEPGTYALMGLGLVGIFWRRRRLPR